MKKTTFPSQNSITYAPCRLALLIIPLALACFALSPAARGVCQEGCLTSANTVLGENAFLNNTVGGDNTAIGYSALQSNTGGFANTAIGRDALSNNTTGFFNTAAGSLALSDNREGFYNTAIGFEALLNNNGSNNTALGFDALYFNGMGSANTAIGDSALLNNAGQNNIALGFEAGINLTTGSNNIDIGDAGVAGESNTIRIGTRGTHTATFIAGIQHVPVSGNDVRVNSNGKLGALVSSQRFKEAIKPMNKTSEAIFSLKPVTFRYKKELDPDGIPQFGLVAEQVEKVNPDLIARDADGKPYTVRYEAVNAMLLNEFLKEHSKVEEQARANEQQERTISELRAALAQQQKQIEALTAGLQKVSAQVEMSRPGPQTVADNH
jgi:uncharacterized coiled-coil protein SlyX